MKKQLILLLLTTVFTVLTYGQNIKKLPDGCQRNKLRQNIKWGQRQIKSSQSLYGQNNLKHRLDSIIEYNQDSNSGNWDQIKYKDTYVYDKNNNEIEWVYSVWDQDKRVWSNQRKVETQYNKAGLQSENIVYLKGTTKLWNSFYKESFEYDEEGTLVKLNFYVWSYESNTWQDAEKTGYSYNADGNILKDSTYYFKTSSKEWVLDYKRDYTYLRDSLLHHIYTSVFDPQTASWEETEDEWYLYDNIVWRLWTITRFKWNKEAGKWERREIGAVHRDSNEWVNGNTWVSWIFTETDTTIQAKKEMYAHDFSVDAGQLSLPYMIGVYDASFFHHKVVSKQLLQLDSVGGDYSQYRNVKYYYSKPKGPSYLTDNVTNNLILYPNPAREHIYIRYPFNDGAGVINIYNVSGQKVLSTRFFSNKSISVDGLAPGVYFYNIYTNGTVATGKLFKE